MSDPLEFFVDARDPSSPARTGKVSVRGRVFETPVFMPVGTAATVKAVAPRDLEEAGVRVILCNTYHLHLRPGENLVARMGGLHRFMGWEGLILTDSGGFQVFSLSDLGNVDDDGMTIKSHIDGSLHRFTPEKAVRIQHELDSDIMMCFDQCLPHTAPLSAVEEALARTTDWAKRCKEEHTRLGSTAPLFGIVQGGMDPGLRRRSAEEIRALDLPGYAVGGLSVGEGKETMFEVLSAAIPHLPRDKPRYLMGVGPPEDIVNAVAAGVDMFDCVVATRNARNAMLFTSRGPLRMRNEVFKNDPSPPDPDCPCPTCARFSRAYLRHLFMAREILGPVLATIHNLWFFQGMMAGIRESIRKGRFETFRREILERYAGQSGQSGQSRH